MIQGCKAGGGEGEHRAPDALPRPPALQRRTTGGCPSPSALACVAGVTRSTLRADLRAAVHR